MTPASPLDVAILYGRIGDQSLACERGIHATYYPSHKFPDTSTAVVAESAEDSAAYEPAAAAGAYAG